MGVCSVILLASLAATPEPLGPGDVTRSIESGGRTRSYLVHVPEKYDPARPTPVVLLLHGAMMNGTMMRHFCGMNSKSDEAGFIAVYPNGTGGRLFLVWNSGTRAPVDEDADRPDDVAFIAQLLDDLATVVNMDPKRVYASGLSNGGMMSYRLAAELSERIAAIGPVAGTMAIVNPTPKRPVSVIHFHGTDDTFVPYEGTEKTDKAMRVKSVADTVRTWAQLDGCPEAPVVTQLPDTKQDGMTVRREVFGPGKHGAEVVLYTIEGGGHTWPGQQPPLSMFGKSTEDISANDLIWEFFVKHPRE